MIALFDLWAFHMGSMWWNVWIGAAVFGFWLALTTWSRKRAYWKLTEATPGSIGLHTLALGPDGIHEQNTVKETIVKWPKVTEIAESPQLVVFFLSPRYGFLIPKRAFPTADGMQAFLETARAYHKSALDGTAPILPEIGASWPPAPQRLV